MTTDESKALGGMTKSRYNENELNKLHSTVGTRLNTPFSVVRYVLQQTQKGATVPFLARYRRDETGNMDDNAIRLLIDTADELQEVNRRRAFMLKSLEDRGLLTREIKHALENLVHLNQLEDAWEPFKEKRTSLAHRGREAQLGSHATKLLHTTERMEDLFKNVRRVPDGERLFQAVVVEEVQRSDALRQRMLGECRQSSLIHSVLVPTARKKKAKEMDGEDFATLKKQFGRYDGRKWSVQFISAHSVLALQRGESKGVLHVKLTAHVRSRDVFYTWARETFTGLQRQHSPVAHRLLCESLNAAYEHVVKTTHSTIRRDLKKSAEKEAIGVFAHSLRHTLLQCPLRDARVLAMDPGVTHGVKCVALDEHGTVLTRFKCFIRERAKMKEYISSCVGKLRLNKIVIGNGTASREVADIVADAIEESRLDVEYAIVSEAGASVYSVSDVAKEEFPTLDAMYRGAVSIGRRVIDPLSELVKIPVRSMGIGMYQHDVSEAELLRALHRVVESCVASVGVNAMSSNRYVIEKIPGVSKQVVDQIVLARHAKKLTSRDDLRRVPGMTEATYQQIAGFFRFPNSANPLDNSNIHPESYTTVHRLLEEYKGKERREIGHVLLHMPKGEFATLADRFGCGQATLHLLARELASPALDPRSELPHVGLFRRAPRRVEELHPGDKLMGVVQNVTTFGAFVDVGLHKDVLVHNVNVDTVHVGSVLGDLIFDGVDELKRVKVQYAGQTHADGKATTPPKGLAIESEDVLPLPHAEGNAPTLRQSLSASHKARHPLFAHTREKTERGDACKQTAVQLTVASESVVGDDQKWWKPGHTAAHREGQKERETTPPIAPATPKTTTATTKKRNKRSPTSVTTRRVQTTQTPTAPISSTLKNPTTGTNTAVAGNEKIEKRKEENKKTVVNEVWEF